MKTRIDGAIEAPFLPCVEGWQDDGEFPLLLEDLASAFWAPPWRPGDLERVVATFHQASMFPKPPPPGTTGLRELQRRVFDSVLPWLFEREGLPPCDSVA